MNGFTSPRRCLTLPLLLALAGTVAGCGTGAEAAAPTGALAIVVGAHSNAPTPVLTGAAANAREMAVNQSSYVSLVVADGAPYQRDLSDSLNVHGSVDGAIAGARAKTPQSDLLAAIDLAARGIGQRPGLRTLVVVDSGLSTLGALDFTQPGLIDADPQDVATTLADSHLLPDLSGIAVIFEGLGETVAPQETLGPVRRTQLENIWMAVAQRAGAVAVQVERPPLAETPAPQLPPVTPVTPGPGYECRPDRMIITGGGVAFKPGSSEFLDPGAAVNLLRPLVEQALNDDIAAVLSGTMADVGDPGARRKLSEDRAQTVANLFISLGVPMSQLKVEGLGSDFEGFVPDHDQYDRVVPAIAARNRMVVIDFDPSIRCP